MDPNKRAGRLFFAILPLVVAFFSIYYGLKLFDGSEAAAEQLRVVEDARVVSPEEAATAAGPVCIENARVDSDWSGSVSPAGYAEAKCLWYVEYEWVKATGHREGGQWSRTGSDHARTFPLGSLTVRGYAAKMLVADDAVEKRADEKWECVYADRPVTVVGQARDGELACALIANGSRADMLNTIGDPEQQKVAGVVLVGVVPLIALVLIGILVIPVWRAAKLEREEDGGDDHVVRIRGGVPGLPG